VSQLKQQHEFAEIMLAYRKLPPEKKKRVNALFTLLDKSDEDAEQLEIALAIAEIMAPRHIGITMDAGSTVDLEAGVTAATHGKVDSYKKNIGDAIRKRREELDLTQEQLAERCGLPQSHICRLEIGKHAPTRSTIERIAKALETEPSKLDLLYD
jgi:DNA-binding XRE family transcriptional regulator